MEPLLRVSIKGTDIHLGDFNFNYRQQDQDACTAPYDVSLVWNMIIPSPLTYIDLFNHYRNVDYVTIQGNVIHVKDGLQLINVVSYICQYLVKPPIECYVFYGKTLTRKDTVTDIGNYVETVTSSGHNSCFFL